MASWHADKQHRDDGRGNQYSNGAYPFGSKRSELRLNSNDCGNRDDNSDDDNSDDDIKSMESNVPIPDPSVKTVDDIREAVSHVRELIDIRLGGIQEVIAERLNSIEKRLDAGMIEIRASAAVALAGVVEAGKDQIIKFETLERRVAALELALSQSGGKEVGAGRFTENIVQTLISAAAIATVLGLYVAWHGLK